MTTAKDIKDALRSRYPYPEWAAMEEVGDNTGFSVSRHADFVVLNFYPSKGYVIYGFEIKVSRSDLLSELKDGKKSDDIAKYCNRWYLVTPKDLVKPTDEIPDTWGLMECHNNKLFIRRQGKELNPLPIGVGFTAAMLRAVFRFQGELIRREERRIAKDYYERNKEAVKREVEQELKHCREDAVAISHALKDACFSHWDMTEKNLSEFFKIAKALKAVGFQSFIDRSKAVRDDLLAAEDALNGLLSEETAHD